MIDETKRDQWHQAVHRDTEHFTNMLWDTMGLDPETASNDERSAVANIVRELGSDDFTALVGLIVRVRHSDAQAEHVAASLDRPAARIRVGGRVEFFELPDTHAHDGLAMLCRETDASLIQTAPGTGDLLLWVDEEGKLRDRPFNRVATSLHLNRAVDPIVGDAVATGSADGDAAPLGKTEIMHLLATVVTASVSVRGEAW